MALGPDEPPAGPWRVEPFASLVQLIFGDLSLTGRTVLVAVDGRSASGKTALAERLCAAIQGATVVHTDDVAWHSSFFDWTALLRDNVLVPIRRGETVHYRPPAREKHGRKGAISIQGNCPLVVIEGVGVARRELSTWFDAIVWVQSDLATAKQRGIVRDGGDEHAMSFWEEWERGRFLFSRAIVLGSEPSSSLPELKS
jgi:uridine kinase